MSQWSIDGITMQVNEVPALVSPTFFKVQRGSLA